MAITLIQTATGETAEFGSPNTAGNFLVCVARSPSTGTVSDSIGNSWVKAGGINNGSFGMFIWYALNCKGGANTILQSGGSGAFCAAEYSGIALTSALDKTNAATGSGNPYAAGSVTPTQASELLIGGVSNETANGQTDTPTGGFTDAIGNNGNVFLANLIVSSLGSRSYGGSYSGSNSWAAAVATFFGVVTTFSISGNAGVAGATVAWNGTSSGSTTADGSGNYTISGLANGPYTITPSKTGYTFSPTSASEIVSGSNITGVNFTASSGPVVLYSVSGNAGVAGATVTYTGASSGSVVSDSTGTYTVFLTAGTYTFTPSLATYTFSPVSKSVTVVASNVYGVNFTAKTFASPWSEVDSRDYGEFPNSTVDVQNTQFYIVPAHPSHVPPVDSRVTKPKDCRKSPNIPLNSRTNPPFES